MPSILDLRALLGQIGKPSEDALYWLDATYFRKTEHVAASQGYLDAGKPLLLGSEGRIDHSMMAGVTFGFTISDWGLPVDDLYSISFVHSLGTASLLVLVFNVLSQQVVVDVEIIGGNIVKISVPEYPDERFNGKAVVIAC